MTAKVAGAMNGLAPLAGRVAANRTQTLVGKLAAQGPPQAARGIEVAHAKGSPKLNLDKISIGPCGGSDAKRTFHCAIDGRSVATGADSLRPSGRPGRNRSPRLSGPRQRPRRLPRGGFVRKQIQHRAIDKEVATQGRSGVSDSTSLQATPATAKAHRAPRAWS